MHARVEKKVVPAKAGLAEKATASRTQQAYHLFETPFSRALTERLALGFGQRTLEAAQFALMVFNDPQLQRTSIPDANWAWVEAGVPCFSGRGCGGKSDQGDGCRHLQAM